MKAKFSDIINLPSQDFPQGMPETEMEIAFGRKVLRKWVRVARWLMPDQDIRRELLDAIDELEK
jgi:hypothetical protein